MSKEYSKKDVLRGLTDYGVFTLDRYVSRKEAKKIKGYAREKFPKAYYVRGDLEFTIYDE